MKKIINENTIKSIVRESLKNYLRESMDSELGMGEEAEGWTPEMDDMWDEFSNNNVHDTNGAFGVLAQGDDDDHVSRVARSLRSTKFDTDANMGEFEDEANEFVSDDNAEYLRDKMFESVVRKSVNETFNKNTNMGKTVKLTEYKLKKIISEAVMQVLNESIDETGAVGAFFNRTFNGKDFRQQAANLRTIINKYQKLYSQNKSNIQQSNNPKHYIQRMEKALKMLNDFEMKLNSGYQINQSTIDVWTKDMDKVLQAVGAQVSYNNKQAEMQKQQQQQYARNTYDYSKRDNYDTSDGISHFGNGDAWRA